MDEKLQQDIYDLLHQFEFITTAQAQATAADTVPLDEPHSQQPPPPIIVYLVDAPPPEASGDYGNTVDSLAGTDEDSWSESFAESVESFPHREEARTTSSSADDERETAVPLSPLPQRDTPLHSALTRPRQQGKRGVLVGVLCVLLVGAALGASLLAPLTASATVTLIPQARAFSITTRLTVVTEGPANPARHEVPGRLLASLILGQGSTVPTTGTGHQEAQAAHGLLTFYNASLDVQTIAAGTTLSTAHGVLIVTEQDAVIPAAATLQTNGQVTVPAHAVVAGPAGNISAGAIYGPCCRLNVSVASGPFRGGQDARSYPLVTAQDVNGATATLQTSLQASVQAALQAQLHPNETLLPPICTPQVTSDHPVGDEARQITVTLTQICRGETYQTQALHMLITQLVTAQANKRLGTGYQLSGDVQSRVTASHLLHGEQVDAGMTIQVRGSGTWSYQFDEAYLHTLATRIAGQSRQQATTWLLHLPGVSQVAMTISDGTSTLPADASTIHVLVLSPPVS